MIYVFKLTEVETTKLYQMQFNWNIAKEIWMIILRVLQAFLIPSFDIKLLSTTQRKHGNEFLWLELKFKKWYA